MKFSKIKIENFKGLKCCDTQVDSFSCIIGKNNAGKSSFLLALYLFITGDRLQKKDYFNPEEDIVITVSLIDISDHDLNRIAEHRERIEPYIDQGRIKISRRYFTDGKSKLRLFEWVPEENRFQLDSINETFSRKRGGGVAEVFQSVYPEIPSAEHVTTQKDAKALIQQYIEGLPENKKVEVETDLPPGIDNSIRALLPEPIFIPAVKDLSDDMSTKTSASFGKLLNLLLSEIEEEFSEAQDIFSGLKKKLNRIMVGEIEVDERIDKIKQVEKAIQSNLNETFKNVSIELKIPSPELKAIFSNTDIIANDGIKGSVEDKGDGFKRALTFSIFRTYSELSKVESWEDEQEFSGRFLILFEEPELYLHPQAQNIMFEALDLLSKRNQTIVSTHSPFLFSANCTKTFIKIDRIQCEKPYGDIHSIDLTDLNTKDLFQIISFESANQAFFSDKIVLVEGDTELILFPHLAKLLNLEWDFNKSSVSLIKTDGKHNFHRYKEFFNKFDVEVFIVCDLDIVLNDFNQLDSENKFNHQRSQLIQAIDRYIDDNGLQIRMNNQDYKRHLTSGERGSIMAEIRQARADNNNDLVLQKLEEFFDFEAINERLKVLKNPPEEIAELKQDLFSAIQSENIFILDHGEIEDYYPPDVPGRDKPTKAQNFCRTYGDKKCAFQALGFMLSDSDQIDDNNEFAIMFTEIFR